MTKSSTPVRNNYAAPHTPITSVKRPRSSLENTSNSNARSAPPSSSKGKGNTTMSPMHPPRPVPSRDENDEDAASWVGRKVDALFSPVLSFLSTKDEDVAAVVTDEDVTMEDSPPKTETEEETERAEEEDDEDFEEEAIGELEEDPSSSFEEEEFNPYLFIKTLPSYELVSTLRPPSALPPKSKDTPPISLVLDLDETLVHCTVEPTTDADLVFPVVFHGMTYQVHVRLRPHLFDFLEKIKGKFEVIVFTASQKVYANELLNLIDPEGKYIQHRMFRESCLPVEGNFLKDLNVLGRDLTKSVLVDNSPHAFGYQVDNGIPIESWFDDPSDTELLKLETFLRTLHDAKDVRTAVREKFKTYKLVEEA